MSTSTAVASRFEIEITQPQLDDLRRRLHATRWARDFANDDWGYGMPEHYLRPLVEYWADEFDWRAQEAAMNEFDHYRTSIDDVPIHFIHQRGTGRRVIPLVMTHGWPWSFWDFRHTIGPLSDPAAHGLDDSIAFDVVVPSLPGFAFSSPLLRPGISPAVTADLWAKLMRDVLGYDRFGAHGGDVGAFVSANLAHAHADKLIGAHLTLPALLGIDFGGSNATGKPFVSAEDYAPEEEGWHEGWTMRMSTYARAHSVVHRASPQTLAWAFNDSPAGLAAWIVERRRNWSDCGGDVENVFPRDFLLSTVSLYYLTETIGTSMRGYRDMGLDTWKPRHERTPVLEAPVGMAVFPRDLLLLPRTMVATYANLVHWTVMPRGGHFAPSEAPELVVEDIRAFFSEL
jgi:pimeloyl-ACP methyl ester carboxylesterase